MKLRVVIVDDEHLARRRLEALLARSAVAELVGTACGAEDALALVARVDPDVALVDVRMPPGDSGLALARRFCDRPAVVFTTAHPEHAVEAFDAAAADYLVKPIELARLERALRRAAERLAAADDPSAPRVVARARGNVHVFPARAIARFRAEDKYTVFAVDGVEYLSDESLAALEHRLAGLG